MSEDSSQNKENEPQMNSTSRSEPINSSQTENGVFPHVEIPDINTLLIGQTPKIYSARDLPPKLMITEPDLPPKVNPRFAPIRTQQPLSQTTNDLPKSARPHYKSRSLVPKPKPFNIEEAKQYSARLNNKLEMYDRAHKTKSYIYAQDYEEHYYIPLVKRIEDKMTKEKYDQFLEKKHENYKKLDEDPIPIHSGKEPGKVEEITYSKKGLKDPADKYKEKEEQENSLVRFLCKANGEPLPPEKETPKETLNYTKYNAMASTKFWLGNVGEPIKHGKKAFPGRLAGTIKTVLPTFPEY